MLTRIYSILTMCSIQPIQQPTVLLSPEKLTVNELTVSESEVGEI